MSEGADLKSKHLAESFGKQFSVEMRGVFDAGLELTWAVPTLKDTADVRAAMPSDGAGVLFNIQREEKRFPLIFLFGNDILEILCLLPTRDGTDPDRMRRLELAGDAATAAIRTIVEANLCDGASLECLGVVVIEGSQWSSGGEPLGDGSLFHNTCCLTAADQRLDSAILLVHPEIPLSCVTIEAPGKDVSLGAGDVVLLAEGGIRDRVAEFLKDRQVVTLPSVNDLLARWPETDIGTAIVEVAPDRLWMLEMLHGLTVLPQCQERPIVVVLDQPTYSAVIECGRLGLFRILPPDFDRNLLLDRMDIAPAESPSNASATQTTSRV